MRQVVIATESLVFEDVQTLKDVLDELVSQAIAVSGDKTLTASEVNVSIDPISDHRKSDSAVLIEETLTDGSKVYNIEIFD